jgi:ABC-type multidrug transport system ATPase subunit
MEAKVTDLRGPPRGILTLVLGGIKIGGRRRKANSNPPPTFYNYIMSELSGLRWSSIVYEIPVGKRRFPKLLSHTTTNSSSEIEKGAQAHIDISTKRILNGLSGHVGRGEFVGILGASGAGKTTLLNALSARMDTTGNLSGQVFFDGQPRKSATWARTVGYVQQDDDLLPRSTVRETIESAAGLRLPDKDFSPEEKKARATEVMGLLRLEDCSYTQVGNTAIRGVSGGERKRTSIAMVSD